MNLPECTEMTHYRKTAYYATAEVLRSDYHYKLNFSRALISSSGDDSFSDHFILSMIMKSFMKFILYEQITMIFRLTIFFIFKKQVFLNI